MADLTDLQYRILDSLYFVEPFEHIVEEAGEAMTLVRAELNDMVARGWVQPMLFDEAAQDYIRTTVYDNDNPAAYRFLATKEGLMRHHGRR